MILRGYEMRTKILNISVLILLGTFLFVLIFGFNTPCSAQILPFFPFQSVFNPTIYPFAFNPFFAPLPTFPAPILSPVLSPYSVLPTFPRAAAATIIIPTAAPAVTAYAPLGTLNITPSTLIFLILYLTLPE
jgi:hypothetical protein